MLKKIIFPFIAQQFLFLLIMILLLIVPEVIFNEHWNVNFKGGIVIIGDEEIDFFKSKFFPIAIILSTLFCTWIAIKWNKLKLKSLIIIKREDYFLFLKFTVITLVILLLLKVFFNHLFSQQEVIHNNFITIVFSIIGVGLLVPLFEEIIFRKLLVDYLESKFNFIVSVIITSFVFMISHASYNFFDLTLIFSISIVFCIVNKRLKSIAFSILIHMIVNCLGVFGL